MMVKLKFDKENGKISVNKDAAI